MKKNNFKSLMQAAVLICTPLVIASCDDVFGDVDNPIPSHLTVSQAAVNLELHAARPDAATFIRKGVAATGAQLVYSSSDEKVATVDANGKITGVGEGECQITVKATGLDSNGKQTYQEAEESFTVKVKDYRARIDLIEGAEIPVYNSADANLTEIDMSKIVKAWPEDVTVTYQITNPTSPAVTVVSTADLTKIVLQGNAGTAKVKAKIVKNYDANNTAMFVTNKTYEQESFPDNQITKEFEITVKEGVAYIAGYDAEGKEIRKTMFMDYNGEKYTKLSDKLKPAGAYATTDVTLDAGWYVVDQNLGGFANNIRVNGDVNFILNGNTFDINGGKVMDETAAQGYKLNFFVQKFAPGTTATGSATFGGIKDFKEVNICGAYINAPVTAVENVTINKGRVGALTGIGTGTVSIIDGKAAFGGTATDIVQKFASLTLAKVVETVALPAYAPEVGTVKSIGTVTLPEGTKAGDMDGITTLTVNKASSIGDLTNIETAVITETSTKKLEDIKSLTLNKVNLGATNVLTRIGSVAINKLVYTAPATEATLTSIQANALNISDGNIVVNKIVGWKNATGYPAQATDLTVSGGALTVNNTGGAEDYAILGNVTMTGGALRVIGPSGTDTYAIRGNVNVDGGLATGKFLANDGSHAVSGTLTGTFEGSSDSTDGTDGTWTAVTGSNKPMWLRNKK
jgi:hypothetical protein